MNPTDEVTEQEVDNALKVESLMMIGVSAPFAMRESTSVYTYFPTMSRYVMVTLTNNEVSIETYTTGRSLNFKIDHMIKQKTPIMEIPIDMFWKKYNEAITRLEMMFHERWSHVDVSKQEPDTISF